MAFRGGTAATTPRGRALHDAVPRGAADCPEAHGEGEAHVHLREGLSPKPSLRNAKSKAYQLDARASLGVYHQEPPCPA